MKILKKKQGQLNGGKLSETDQHKLESFYRKGPDAYGSVTNLQKETKLTRVKKVNFSSRKGAHTN